MKPKNRNILTLIPPEDEAAWQEHCIMWTQRMVRKADVAFAEYICGLRDKESLYDLIAAADDACSKHVSPVRLKHVPPWFKKRLKRVLGRNCFDHLDTTSPWFERAGSVKTWLNVIAHNPHHPQLFAQARQQCDVFIVEPVRPWVIDSSDRDITAMTPEEYEEAVPIRRGAFIETLDKLLAQPRQLAEALRCDLQIEREAYGGWHRMRLIFMPLDVQENDYITPYSFHTRTCTCRDCMSKPRHRPTGAVCECEKCAPMFTHQPLHSINP